MYAECPHCHAIFRVSQKILETAGGKVRCGECKIVFQAVAAGKQHHKPPRENQLIDSSRVEKSSKESPKVRSGQEKQRPSSVTQSGLHVKPPADDLAEDYSAELPKFLPAQIKPPRYKRIRQPVKFGRIMALLLLVLLAVQYLLANRNVLSEQAFFRPIIAVMCQVTGCQVSPRRAIAKIELLNHGIYSHPTVENALMIKAVMENHASFSQPYPVIELSFSDIQGRTVALRRFGPREYLDPELAPDKLMPHGVAISASLQVIDPGKKALAFEFQLL